MKNQYKLCIANEKTPRRVGVSEILLTEKLYEISEFIDRQMFHSISIAEQRQHHISKALGARLSPDARSRIATIQEGQLHLMEIH